MSIQLKRYIILLSFFISLDSSAQKTANQILYGLYQKATNTKDYTADAHIKIDLPFIRMLPVDANVFYKQPDKFRVKSKSIAILPKQGISDFSAMIKDTNSYTAVISGNEKLNQKLITLINIIPNEDTSDLILGKLWVDTDRNLVLKSQLTTRSNGTLFIEYFYASQLFYGLPDSIIFTVDVKKFKMPKGVTADINNSSTPETNDKAAKKGKIFITLRNYRVNKGIADSVFTEK